MVERMQDLTRRTALTGLIAAAAATGVTRSVRAQAPVSFTDMAGRGVTLPHPPQRIILTEANDLLSFALLDPDPAAKVVGWAALRRFDNGTLEAYRRRFPAIDRIEIVGDWSAESFAAEKAIALKPDLVLMTAYQEPGLGNGDLTRRFEAAGIPVAFVTSGANTRTSATEIAPKLKMFGTILGREREAEDYIGFYRRHLDAITERIARANPSRPSVLIETYAGLGECCRAPGRHGWSEFVELAGGRNLGIDTPQAGGMLSLEYLLAQEPQIYIGNGGSYLDGKGLMIGPGYDRATIRASLERLTERSGFREIRPVREGKVYAIWTVFATQPINIVAIEQIAKWLHPDLFANLDPAATMAAINRRLSVPMEGIYWLGLNDQEPAR
jgi:iron complex transport system substrate-binding protein